MDSEDLIRAAFEYAENAELESSEPIKLYSSPDICEDVCVVLSRDADVARFLFFFLEILFDGRSYEWATTYLVNTLSQPQSGVTCDDELDGKLAFSIWSRSHSRTEGYPVNALMQTSAQDSLIASQLEIWTFPRIKSCMVNIF